MTKEYFALLDDGSEITIAANSYEAALCLAAAVYPETLCAVLQGEKPAGQQPRRWFFGDERETRL